MNTPEIYNGQETVLGLGPALNPGASSIPRKHTIVRLDEVLKQTSLSKTSIYGMIAGGLFPEQVPLGKRSVGWIEEEIDEWVRSRMALR